MSNERMDYESRRALVFQAATEIAETGQVPSLEAVKLKVGGGSYTTLTRALREWRKEKDRQQTAVEPGFISSRKGIPSALLKPQA